jgi:ketosteroid isomerase-like protein
MQKSLRILCAAALIGLGVWVWQVFFPSAEKAIRSRLAELARTASFKPADGTVPKTLKAQKLPEFFTADAVILLDARGFRPQKISGREEIQQQVTGAMHFLQGLHVEFLDINLTFDPDKRSAIANLTGKAIVDGERDFYVLELNFMLKKVDGEWLIYRVETVKTIAHTGRRPFESERA